MEDKLYAHHAVQDSLEIRDEEIYDYVDQSIAYFTEQLGSIEKVLEYPFIFIIFCFKRGFLRFCPRVL